MGGAERPPSAFTGPIAWAIFFGNHTMKNPLLSFALAAAIFAISSGNVANALQIGDFFQNAEVIKANSVKIVNDSLIKVNTTIKGYAANAPYAIKTVDVPKPTFMSHVKSNVNGLVKKNAWYAAWFASMAAAGWAIDELTGQMSATTKKKRGSCYQVTGGHALKATDVSVSGCADAQKRDLNGGSDPNRFQLSSTSPPQSTTVNGKERLGFTLVFIDGWTGKPWTFSMYIEVESSESKTEPVSDQSLYDSLASFMLQDPKAAAQAFMVPDAWPYPYPNLFPNTVKYIPGVSEADEQLLDALIKGQLQTTNPNAANYVTPEKLQQLQNTLSQLQQGLTPEGQVGAANDKLKDALTQAQLEETIKKEKEAEEKAVKDALGEKPSFDKLSEPLDKFVENVNKTPQDEINPLPQNTFGIAGSGTCYKIEKPISIMGVTVNMSTRSFCEAYYYPYFLPILTWFFYIATGLYIWFSLRDAYSRRI